MSVATRAEQGNGCPDHTALAAYGAGRLSWEVLERVTDHLSGCLRCTELLGRLTDGEDELLDRLRLGPRKSPYWDEPECARLEAAARAVAVPSLSTVAEEGAAPPEGNVLRLPWPFGPYQLLAPIGRGGMGTVYQARQLSLQRIVALKVLSAGAHAGPDLRSRFRRESEAIARLRHPNIIQVYDCGEHEGQPYFSMELAQGGSLSRQLGEAPLPSRAAAELVQALARAVEHAHQHGILHRDLKPSNVLLTEDGKPKVSDFGLAKLLDDEGDLTQSDLILGTPSYMAPEQAWGTVREVGPAADVYALGAILYECLTGRPPFRAGSSLRTLELVRSAEPVPPSRYVPEVSRELEAICLKCLEKRPAHRYASADALADDLGNWLEGTAVCARPRRWPVRVWRRASRRPVVAALVLLAVLAAVLTTAVCWFADPDRPAKDAQSKLAWGWPVTLLGNTGMPRWYRWRGVAGHLSLAGDGTLTVESHTVGLLELLPDPGRDRYKVRAWVRHEQGANAGSVGIYCGHRQYGRDAAGVHVFAELIFNDVHSRVEDLKAILPHVPNVPVPADLELNAVTLNPRLYAMGGPGEGGDLPGPGPSKKLFRPAGPGNKTWRELTLDVTPERVEASWNGTPVGVLLTADARDSLAARIPELVGRRPGDPVAAGVDPSFSPRGGLGLYVSFGAACFRSVTIEPLAEGDETAPQRN